MNKILLIFVSLLILIIGISCASAINYEVNHGDDMVLAGENVIVKQGLDIFSTNSGMHPFTKLDGLFEHEKFKPHKLGISLFRQVRHNGKEKPVYKAERKPMYQKAPALQGNAIFNQARGKYQRPSKKPEPQPVALQGNDIYNQIVIKCEKISKFPQPEPVILQGNAVNSQVIIIDGKIIVIHPEKQNIKQPESKPVALQGDAVFEQLCRNPKADQPQPVALQGDAVFDQGANRTAKVMPKPKPTQFVSGQIFSKRPIGSQKTNKKAKF